jgi:excisionase family DNA binding protein
MAAPIPPIVLDITSTCRALSLGRTRVYELVNEGKLTASKIGRRTMIHMASIDRLVKETVIKEPIKLDDEK